MFKFDTEVDILQNVKSYVEDLLKEKPYSVSIIEPEDVDAFATYGHGFTEAVSPPRVVISPNHIPPEILLGIHNESSYNGDFPFHFDESFENIKTEVFSTLESIEKYIEHQQDFITEWKRENPKSLDSSGNIKKEHIL